jgi:hypothetical protein
MKLKNLLVVAVALMGVLSVSGSLSASDAPMRTAVYTQVGDVANSGPEVATVAYPRRAYYRPYYAPYYRPYIRPYYAYRPYPYRYPVYAYRPYVDYRPYGAYYGPGPYYW